MLEILIKILLFLSKFLISCSAIRYYFKQNVFNFPLKTQISFVLSSEIVLQTVHTTIMGSKLVFTVSEIQKRSKNLIFSYFSKKNPKLQIFFGDYKFRKIWFFKVYVYIYRLLLRLNLNKPRMT